MDKASDSLLALKPVTFRYKKDIDPTGTTQFGLVAEEVEKVNPDLVVRDKHATTYSVRYDQVNAMLLNEFLKAHKTVQEQQARIASLESTVAQQLDQFRASMAQQQADFQSRLAEQKKQIAALASGFQNVSAQLELSKAAPRTAFNDQ